MNAQIESVRRQRGGSGLRAPTQTTVSSPRPAAPPARPEPRSRAAIEAAEQARWVRIVGTPFLVSAVFFGAAIASGIDWLIGPAIVLGPILMVAAYILVMLSSDANVVAGSEPMLRGRERPETGAGPVVRAA